MTPKLSPNMQRILRDPKALIKLNKFLNSDKKTTTVIEADGKIIKLMTVKNLHEENRKNNR